MSDDVLTSVSIVLLLVTLTDAVATGGSMDAIVRSDALKNKNEKKQEFSILFDIK